MVGTLNAGILGYTQEEVNSLLSTRMPQIGYDDSKELTESWASLQARIKTGDFSGIRIGDYKPITLTTGETLKMQVAAIDKNEGLASPVGSHVNGHHVDFISYELLNQTYAWNTKENLNNGTAEHPVPWLASDLYQSLNDENTGVYSTLPSDVKEYITPRIMAASNKYSSAGLVTGYTWYTSDVNLGKLWLPAIEEVCEYYIGLDVATGSTISDTSKFPLFITVNNRKKKPHNAQDGNCVYWWTMTSSIDSTKYVKSCSSTGYHSNNNADGFLYIPLCFRIG